MCAPVLFVSAPASSSLPLTLTLTSVNPITRLLEKRQQLLSVQQSLDAQKDDYSGKESLFKRREENLRKKDLELQEALVLFNKFLKENELKRRRAEQRANEEIKKRLHWEREIVNRRAVLDGLRKRSARLRTEVRRNERYQQYLQCVFDDHSQPFEEVHSIIGRYATLASTNADLLSAQQSSAQLAEQHRTLYSTTRKERHNEILQLTNEVALWSAEYERVERARRDVEEGMEADEQQYEGTQRELIQIILGTENLHQRCKRELQGIRRHGEAALGATEAEGQGGRVGRLEREVEGKLAEIGEYVVDVQDIVESVGGLSMESGRPRGGAAAAAAKAGKDRDRERAEDGRDREKERESHR